MRSIICKSLKGFKKLLKSGLISPDTTILASISSVIHPEEFPDEYITFLLGKALTPSPNVLNLYFAGNDIEEYYDACKMWFSNPKQFIYINEVIYRACPKDMDIVWISSDEEEEFGLLHVLGELLDGGYGLASIKSKSFIEGKKGRKVSHKELLEQTEDMREHMVRRFNNMDIQLHPTMYMRIPKKYRKDLPKHLKRVIKSLVTVDWR